MDDRLRALEREVARLGVSFADRVILLAAESNPPGEERARVARILRGGWRNQVHRASDGRVVKIPTLTRTEW